LTYQMKNRIILLIIVLLSEVFWSGVAFAQVIYKKPPKYQFETTTTINPNGIIVDTLGEAFAAVKAYYESQNNSTATYTVENLRPFDLPIINGLPVRYLWNVTVRNSDGLVRNYEDWSIWMGSYCEQDTFSSDSPARWVGAGNGIDLFWCERQEEVNPEIDVSRLSTDLTSSNTCGRDSEFYTRNPLLIPTGEKVRVETDYFDNSPHPLTFKRIYRSGLAKDLRVHEAGFGHAWRHNFHGAVKQLNSTLIKIDLPNGMRKTVVRDTYPVEKNWRVVGSYDALTKLASGWEYVEHLTGTKHSFTHAVQNSSAFLISSSTDINGHKYSYLYNSSDRLSFVINNFGRSLNFSALSPDGEIARISFPDGSSADYSWAGKNYKVNYADRSTRAYSHGGVNARLLSAIDVNDRRWADFTYDGNGDALSSQLVGGVDKYVVSSSRMGDSSNAAVVKPNGLVDYYTYRFPNGQLHTTSMSEPAASGVSVVSQRIVNDAGQLTKAVSFTGTESNYFWNERRLPVLNTEATGQPDERSTQYEWHPQWRLPLKVNEAGRLTEYTYDERGNRLSQTVTDSTTARTTRWTYTAQSLVATETAPNGATTSYQYDSLGNLTQSTNALGHTQRYTHDGAGRVLTHTDPNGTLSTYTYDPRGRMLSASVGGIASHYTYTPSGQLASAQFAHGHRISYQYDAAQRLVGWSDNRGASASYALDPMGNRTSEEIRNAQGHQVWQLARSINSLNRVESTTQAGQTTRYGYDANGDLTHTTNGAGETTHYGLDALRRVQTLTNAANASAALGYNAQDAITQASDYKGVTTTYGRDAQGNPTQETSPDSGSQTTQYDALGLPRQQTDALGRTTTYERDLLGRPTRIAHPDGTTTTLQYDQGAVGYLSSITDPSSTTTYERDSLGRTTRKTQTLASGHTRSIGYQYNASGQLASTTYPGGQVLQNNYDSTGQITGLTWAGHPLINAITWNPLGQPTGWSWNLPTSTTAIAATRSYNTAGQPTATELSNYQYDGAGRIHTLTQKLWRPANTNPQASTITQATSTWSVQYNPAGRITGFTKTTAANTPPDSTTYQYDANGNLTSSQREAAATNTTRTYSADPSHNKLLGFEQTSTSATGTATTSVTHQYDAAGNLQTDGLHHYHYDSQGRLQSSQTGQGPDAPTTRYAHNALGQRVFKTEPLFAAASSKDGALDDEEEDPSLLQTLVDFFTRLWNPAKSDAEHLGWAYLYDEDGSLLGEYGMGGAQSAGQSQYIYLPTAQGPIPMAAEIDNRLYAIHTDHLGTPRRLTQADGQAAWQWAYSAYGDEAPTLGAKRFTNETTNPTTGATNIAPVRFNLRYPGQYFDEESGLHYNYFRSYDPKTGRYTQSDPIGLQGGWNRYAYVGGNPLSLTDPKGLTPFQSFYLQLLLLNQRYGPAATALAADLAGVNGTLSTAWPGLSALPRALTAADLGLEGALAACKGSISFDGKTILMNVDYIEGTIPHGRDVLKKLIDKATFSGAQELRIQATIANEGFYKTLPRFGFVAQPGVNGYADQFVLPILVNQIPR
jgi:RHS repeat-associated protein